MTTRERRTAGKRAPHQPDEPDEPGQRSDPGETIGGEGRPIREYLGWDDAAGVFRQDDPALRPVFKTRRHAEAKPVRAVEQQRTVGTVGETGVQGGC